MNKLDELHDAIFKTIKEAIPAFVTLGDAPEILLQAPEQRCTIRTPALYVQMLEAEPLPDKGDEVLALNTTWQATCIVGKEAEINDRQRVARTLALYVAKTINNDRFNVLDVEPAKLTRLQTIDVDEEMARSITAWTVDWQQVVNVGRSIWDVDGVTPTELNIGNCDVRNLRLSPPPRKFNPLGYDSND